MSNVELVLWSGLLIGLAFGAVGQVSGFCLHRGLVQKFSHQPGHKLQSFALALLVAIVGTQWFAWQGVVDLSQSIYRMPAFSWLLVPLGGLLFGYGMALTNGCSARALVLLGQGNLRSAVVLLCLGVSAYATLTGVLAPLRVAVAEPTTWSPGVWGGVFGPFYQFIAVFLVLVLAWLAFWKTGLLQQRKDLIGGFVVGVLVVVGWYVTGDLGADDFDPVPLESITFVAPVGETIQYAMIATGIKPGFGVLVVCGVVLGALAAALLSRRFEWQGFQSPSQMRRYMLGGIMMGVGGALAMGCSVGQGLTGMSTLSPASMMALLGILGGSFIAQKIHR